MFVQISFVEVGQLEINIEQEFGVIVFHKLLKGFAVFIEDVHGGFQILELFCGV